MTEYLINHIGLVVCSNTTVYGGNEYGIKSGQFYIFASLKHFFNDAFEAQFLPPKKITFLYHVTDTDSMYGHAAQILLKWKDC